MPATRNQLLGHLHCIRRDRKWSEDEYRDILEARTGKRSAADLDGPTLARVVAELAQNSAPAERRENEWAWVDTAAEDRRAMLRKLIVLAGPQGAKIKRGGQVAYIEGIAKQMAGGVTKPLRMCARRELHKIVQALEIHVGRGRR